MVLTEKVKETIGGKTYKVFEVTALTGGATGNQTISLGAVAMNEIVAGIFSPSAITMTAGALTYPVLKTWTTSGGGSLVISGVIASSTPDVGILEVWGY
jgi:hypothetical protein